MSTFEQILKKDGKLIYKTKGVSMNPMLYQNRDLVVLRPPEGRLKEHDVALYRRGKTDAEGLRGIEEAGEERSEEDPEVGVRQKMTAADGAGATCNAVGRCDRQARACERMAAGAAWAA